MKPKVEGQRSHPVSATPIQPRSGPKGLITKGAFELSQTTGSGKGLAATGMEENVDIRLVWPILSTETYLYTPEWHCY